MAQEPKEREPRFFKWIYMPLIAPAILLVLGAIITGRIVISITGFQLSIGLTVLITLLIFAVMIISFFLGMGFFVVAIFSGIAKTKMPWPYRLIVPVVSVVIAPFVWFSKKRDKKQAPPAETDTSIAAIA